MAGPLFNLTRESVLSTSVSGQLDADYFWIYEDRSKQA
jgi:hypothetical protein